MGARLSRLPDAVQARIRAMAREQGITIEQPAARIPSADPTWWQGTEGDLQKACEAMLRERGYWPRSKRYIMEPPAGEVCRGWYVHLPRAVGNPYLLDLLIMGAAGGYIEVELKTASGTLSPIQRVLCALPGRCVCRSVEELARIVTLWEGQADV